MDLFPGSRQLSLYLLVFCSCNSSKLRTFLAIFALVDFVDTDVTPLNAYSHPPGGATALLAVTLPSVAGMGWYPSFLFFSFLAETHLSFHTKQVLHRSNHCQQSDCPWMGTRYQQHVWKAISEELVVGNPSDCDLGARSEFADSYFYFRRSLYSLCILCILICNLIILFSFRLRSEVGTFVIHVVRSQRISQTNSCKGSDLSRR